MLEKNVNVASTLEARPAALFVQLAGKFKSTITISMQNKHSNCKSIMGIISLGILEGSYVSIQAQGEDEAEAIKELGNFLLSEKH